KVQLKIRRQYTDQRVRSIHWNALADQSGIRAESPAEDSVGEHDGRATAIRLQKCASLRSADSQQVKEIRSDSGAFHQLGLVADECPADGPNPGDTRE